VAEALTNVTKHARAEHAAVTASVEDGTFVAADIPVPGSPVDRLA
jgi:nitrate/nitrite-specific signal transduction histidine kinase